jgi:histidinol-phosphate aminotransferase
LRTQKLIILDEAYIDYAPANSAALIRKDKNLIIVRTLSKAYLAAGLRIGFIISHADNVAILKKITPPWALNHISQSLAYELLSSDSLFNNYVNIVSVSKTYLYEELNKMGVTFYPSHTNFILIKFENVDEIVQELDKQDILVSNKSKLKGLEGCMRVTIGPIEVMKHFVFALKSILQKK